MVAAFEPFTTLENFMDMHSLGDADVQDSITRAKLQKKFFSYQQFARRIIFHQPTLFMKSIGKVSFLDIILDDEFSMEDIFRFLELFTRPLELPLLWFKDSIVDALAMHRHGTFANLGRKGKS